MGMVKKKIVVVGVGALGSNMVMIGRNLPVEWTVIDDDRVETKNIASQFHTKMALNKNKTQSLAQSMKALFGVTVKPIPHRLTKDNVQQLLGNADVVIDCLDNAPSRRIVQAFVRDNNVPCLHGALAADGQFGTVMWDELFRIDSEDVEGQATCDGGDFLPFIVEVSSALVQAVRRFLDEGKKTNFQIHPQRKFVI